MPRHIIALTLAVLYINFGFAQNEFEKKLLDQELAYFHASSDSVKSRCVLKKMNLYFSQNVVDERLFFEIKRLENDWILEEEKTNLYWNISVASYLLDQPYYYLSYASRYRERAEAHIEMDILDFLSYVKRDKSMANNILEKLVTQDSTLSELSKLITANFHESRFKVLARFSSLVVPGSGLFISKEPLKGATSLGLNTVTFFAVRYLIQNALYFNSVAWGINLIQRFYVGGVALTEKMILKKESKEKAHLADEAEDALKVILMKYPLEFKN